MTKQQFDVVYFSIDNWSEYKKRPHHFAENLARLGHRVLFVEEGLASQDRIKRIASRLPKIQISEQQQLATNLWRTMVVWQLPTRVPFVQYCSTRINRAIIWNRVRRIAQALKFHEVVTIASNIYSLPLQHLAAPRPNNREFSTLLVYDCVDAHEEFPGVNPQLAINLERAIVSQSDLVFATARQLLERIKKTSGRSAFYVPNGVDFERFNARPAIMPPEIRELKQKKYVVLGYIGAVADWVDMAILDALLSSCQWTAIVLVGPIMSGINPAAIKDCLSSLLTRHGRRFLYLGSRPYETMPEYVNSFDICLLPFRRTALVKYVNPIKIYEYFAAGKPVICTEWDEIMPLRALVEVVDANSRVPELIARSLDSVNDSRLTQMRLTVARNHDWQQLVKSSVEIIQLAFEAKRR